ncbi:MAG: DUF692 domain-containing protein [Pseudomonadales bacterium]|jgi:uncharacterized protein (UPF0276 family)|nr:DUF692 domain-containing protein [Pseudomonadales bacterium]
MQRSSHVPVAAVNKAGLPLAAGLGLKPRHFQDVLDSRPAIGWFEVHPENYLVAGGPLLAQLERIRADYPLSFHSVGMSLGSADGVDTVHLRRLRALAERFEPAQMSDHLSWSRHGQRYLNDLLPMPLTTAALAQMCRNVMQAQDILGRTLALENPSSYLHLPGAQMSESDFLVELCRRTDARILLDVNNIYVSGHNLGWSPLDYLQSIPPNLVAEVHLAGHKVEVVEQDTLLIDDHGSPVCAAVWQLYESALSQLGPAPVLIEWDTDVPPLSVLLREADTAQHLLQSGLSASARRSLP